MSFLQHLHPATVHFPIALLLFGSALTLVQLGRRAPFDLKITVWLLLSFGWIGGVVAVLTGLLAQANLPPDAPYRTVLNFHIGAGLGVLVVYGFLLYQGWLYRGTKAQNARKKRGVTTSDLLDDETARWWVAVITVVGALLILATGWYGGVLVYTFGVNITTALDLPDFSTLPTLFIFILKGSYHDALFFA